MGIGPIVEFSLTSLLKALRIYTEVGIYGIKSRIVLDWIFSIQNPRASVYKSQFTG